VVDTSGRMRGVGVELPSLGANRAIVALPPLTLEQLLPVCELLCQEGFTTWSLTASRLAVLDQLRAAFGRRVRIGVQNVTQESQIKQAADAGAEFAGSICFLPDLVRAVSGFPVILGGFTPTELLAGVDAGAAAVQLVPSGVHLAFDAESLIGLVGERLIAGGHLEPTQALSWLEVGAMGFWSDQLVDPDFAVEPALGELREDVQRWRLEG
jgi:2-dehydro-3-deoxyphosphogluconate aldolase / (4S)-4-hydroxy-2-oxoglutarate aldolase